MVCLAPMTSKRSLLTHQNERVFLRIEYPKSSVVARYGDGAGLPATKLSPQISSRWPSGLRECCWLSLARACGPHSFQEELAVERWLSESAAEAGIDEAEARVLVTAVLRRLHRMARTDPAGLSVLAQELRLVVGLEACWHMIGLLELQRTEADPEIPWSETLGRMDKGFQYYAVLIEKWRQERSS